MSLCSLSPKFPSTVLAANPVINGAITHDITLLCRLDGGTECGVLDSPPLVYFAGASSLDHRNVGMTVGWPPLHKYFVAYVLVPWVLTWPEQTVAVLTHFPCVLDLFLSIIFNQFDGCLLLKRHPLL